jgi:hypothetical protein
MSSLEQAGSGTRTSADRSDTSDRDSSSTADTLQHQAGRVTDEVREQAVSLGEDARRQLHTQARVQTEHLGETLESVADHLHALADGRPEEAGQARDLLDRIADQVSEASQRIDELGFDGAVDELQRFARRRPGVFLASAAAIGFAGSRLAQGAKAERDGPDRGSRSGNGNGSGTADRGGQRSTAPSSGQLPADRPPTVTSGPSAVPAATPGHISGPGAREGGR